MQTAAFNVVVATCCKSSLWMYVWSRVFVYFAPGAGRCWIWQVLVKLVQIHALVPAFMDVTVAATVHAQSRFVLSELELSHSVRS